MSKVSRIIRRLVSGVQESKTYPIRISTDGPPKGKVLLSYLAEPASWSEQDARFWGHTNKWESRRMVYAFHDLGYEVDVIDYTDHVYEPKEPYDIFLDIYVNLQRLAPLLPSGCVRILHLTGSYWYYQNKMELARVQQFESSKGFLYSPKRLVAFPELFDRSLMLSHYCSLIGSTITLETYPAGFHSKVHLCPASYSYIGAETADNLGSPRPEFLWFGGGGLVLKGLDLVIDAFLEREDLKLNIVGPMREEKDFCRAYRDVFETANNIEVHGVMNPSSDEFHTITRRCGSFIAPSVSEGMSTAALTCMAFGLYPIISRETGVVLPQGCGLYLEELSCKGILRALDQFLRFSCDSAVQQSRECREFVLQQHSRSAFGHRYMDFLLDCGL